VGVRERERERAYFTMISLIRVLISSLGTQKEVGGYFQNDEG
jgi:hypothetical protein